jgi:hypothetical protein
MATIVTRTCVNITLYVHCLSCFRLMLSCFLRIYGVLLFYFVSSKRMVYVCMYVCVCVYIYIYIYIHYVSGGIVNILGGGSMDFFYWRYNPLWVLAFLVIFFHSAFSLHNFLHPLIPIMIWYIYLLLQLGCHPVAVVQYTFTHKQYTEQHKNKLEQCEPCPVLASYTLAFAVQLRKKHGKTSVRVAEQ